MSTRDNQTDRIKSVTTDAMERRWNRRKVVQTGVAGAAGIAAADLVGASGVGAAARQATPEPRRGGRLRIGTTGQPAGYDMHLLNNRTVTLTAWNMYEALFTFDADYATVPMLAKGLDL